MVLLPFSRCACGTVKILSLLLSYMICAAFVPATSAFQSPTALTRISRKNIVPNSLAIASFRKQTHLCSLSLPDLERFDVSVSTDQRTNTSPTSTVDETTASSSLIPATVETTPSEDYIISTPPPLILSGQALVVIAAAMYGTNFPCVKLLDQIVPSALSAALRFSLAAIVVGGAVILSEQRKPQSNDRFPSMFRGMEVGAWYAIGYLSQALALQHAEAGKCAFFNALAVVIVPLLEALCNKTPPSLRSTTACLLAVSGVALLELGGASTSPALDTGDMMSVVMSLSFAVGYWRLGKATEDYPHQAARITLGQVTSVALGTVAYAIVALPAFWAEPYSGDLVSHWLHDPFVLGALIWTGLASTALALYLETIALRTISAAELTVLMTSTSLWAAAFSYVTLGEVLVPTAMGGGLLILAGCLVSAQLPNREEEEEEKVEVS